MIQTSNSISLALMASTIVVPFLIAIVLGSVVRLSPQNVMLVQCFSLLLLGAALSTLATLNFSQALFVGLLASPLSFVRPLVPPKALPSGLGFVLGVSAVVAIIAFSPPAILMAASHISGKHYTDLLAAAAWAWKVEKVWTAVTVWIVWWPAWVSGSIVLLSGIL